MQLIKVFLINSIGRTNGSSPAHQPLLLVRVFSHEEKATHHKKAPLHCERQQIEHTNMQNTVQRSNMSIQDKGTTPAEKEDSDALHRELCRKLAANDATMTSLSIGDTNMTDQRAVEIGNALFNNAVVNKIIFDLRFLHKYGGSVFCFLDHLQTSSSLLTVELKNASLLSEAVACTVTVLLDAISNNNAVKDLTLDSKLSAEQAFSAHFLRKSKELAYKVLQKRGDQQEENRNSKSKDASVPMATALTQCISLESVWLEHLDETILCRLLVTLQQLPALQSVAVLPKHYCVETFNKLKGLLHTSQALQQVELHGCRLTARRFDPVIAGLSESESVAELSLHDCRLDRPATILLEGLLTNNTSSVTTLTLGYGVKMAGRNVSSVLRGILLSPTGCSLTGLNLRYHDLGSGVLELLGTLEELDTNFIERLALGHISTEEQLEALKSTVSNLKNLREILVDLSPNLWEQHEDLLDSFKCNASLEECIIDEEVFRFVQKKKKKKTKGVKEKKGKKKERRASAINENLKEVLTEEEIEQLKDNRKRLQGLEQMSEHEKSMHSDAEDSVRITEET